jgi:hypothetical protein
MNHHPKKATARLKSGRVVNVYRWAKNQNIYIDSSDCKTEYKVEDLEFISERF